MTDLENFSKFTIEEQHGVWIQLEESDTASLHKSQSTYCDGRNYSYNSPVYQVFDAAGKRLFVSTNYIEAVRYFERL